jgi:hypothetical protein
MKLFRLISITCATLLTFNLSYAEDWYQIEVIAFEYAHPNESDVELWENQPGEPDWKSGVSLTDEQTAKVRRQQEEAAKAPPPPPPAPTHAQAPENNMVEQGDHGDDDDSDTPHQTPPPPPAPKPAPVAEKPADPSQQKFVTVEEILTGQHEQNAQAPAAAPGQPPLDFVGLPSSQFTMIDVERKLHRQGTYKILTHTAWRQSAFTGNNNQGVHIFGGRLLDHEGPLGNRYEFEGLVSLKSNRYLHLDVDALLRGLTKDQGSKFNAPADLALLESSQQGKERAHVYQVYRLEQSQRVRSNKVYYFDHPLMGVIVKISPYGG